MKKDSDDYYARDLNNIHKIVNTPTPQGKLNILLEELLEKKEEALVYKNRLKELETAFYYNLDVIAERDLELSVLEKQLSVENKRLMEVMRERDELQDLLKVTDEKNNKKTQQLKLKLSSMEKEIINLQRENVTNVNTLKRFIDNLTQQQQKTVNKMVTKLEINKEEIIKSYREDFEKREKCLLLEIDNMKGKLKQVNREKEEVEEKIKNLKHHLQDTERLFLEKENQYLQQIKKLSFSNKRIVNAGVQCDNKPQVLEKPSQAQPNITSVSAQTVQTIAEEEYVQRINFLQEQNEVLKYIVKDLKRNQNINLKPEDQGCECLALKRELEQVNKKFENELNNLKKILEEEQKQRIEEDATIQNLETNVCCLRDKLLSGLQEKLKDFEGKDICAFTYNREIENEIQITLLEQKLEALTSIREEERQTLQRKLENIEKQLKT